MIPPRKNIDLNLLVCLDALLTEGSVTRAAERLNMSQPGMSHALSRLRTLTGDALFVRTGNDFIPTERAQVLSGKVRSSLAALEEIFSEEGPFDPASTAGTLTVAAVDSVSLMIVPRLTQALAQQAPLIKLHVRLPDPDKLHGWLAEGECDIALGYFPDPMPELRASELFGQTLSCISGPRYPGHGQPMDVARYVAASHVVFGSPFSLRSPMESAIDDALAAQGMERTRTVQVSSMLLVPYVVANSSHVAALPDALARHCASFLPLALCPLPVKVEPIVIRMLWHERTHRVGLQRWVRSLIRSTMQEVARDQGVSPLAAGADDLPAIDG
ncbi:LysR family transcriptional regulator [Variovorax sp. KK3]|uniref:LysR family transcriptional regulator n=1 Tax=Variovorax sp. KK3 TaxID=1855728 RepID=UPI0015C3E693|nr:LysR family transcriptional regulator [Variovorax sp. KK3]